jgi:hypothetical protein
VRSTPGARRWPPSDAPVRFPARFAAPDDRSFIVGTYGQDPKGIRGTSYQGDGFFFQFGWLDLDLGRFTPLPPYSAEGAVWGLW